MTQRSIKISYIHTHHSSSYTLSEGLLYLGTCINETYSFLQIAHLEIQRHITNQEKKECRPEEFT